MGCNFKFREGGVLMKVKYIGGYDFISGLNYGDITDVEFKHETYVNGLTPTGRRVIVESKDYEDVQ